MRYPSRGTEGTGTWSQNCGTHQKHSRPRAMWPHRQVQSRLGASSTHTSSMEYRKTPFWSLKNWTRRKHSTRAEMRPVHLFARPSTGPVDDRYSLNQEKPCLMVSSCIWLELCYSNRGRRNEYSRFWFIGQVSSRPWDAHMADINQSVSPLDRPSVGLIM